MSELKNGNLQFSCPENRNSLNTNRSAYFCDQCKNNVFDFKYSSKEDIMNAIENSTKPICGIFKRSQLSERFIKYAAATFIATTSISLQANGQSDIKLDSLEQACEYLDEHEHTDEFFGMIVEVQAEPIGGYKKFFEAIGAEIEFPRGLTEPGKVYLQFEVDTLGSMSNLTVVKTFNDLAGQEAIRTLQKLDYHFNPAEQRGKKVKSKMIIPITFDLDN